MAYGLAWREPLTVLTLVGRYPEAQNLDELTARGGCSSLDGVHAGNMGFSVRTAKSQVQRGHPRHASTHPWAGLEGSAAQQHASHALYSGR